MKAGAAAKRFGIGAGIAGVFALGWFLGAPPSAEAPAEAETAAEVWTCSMHPQVRMPGPGKCPICGMDLIKLEAGAAGTAPLLTLSPAAVKLARVRTAPVERRPVEHTVRLVGKVTFDETRQKEITAWFAGRIDRMFVDYEGMSVRRGDHLYEIYSPDLITAHEELQQALRMVERLGPGAAPAVRSSAERTVASVREKLRRWGLTSRQVERLETQRKSPDRLTIYAPQGGVVVERAKVEGTYVETGTRIYRIADLSYVWVEADAYEQHIPWLRFGQRAHFTVEAMPGRAFEGLVSFIDPLLDERTRSVKVRIAVSNADGALKPGMFARVTLESRVAGPGRLMEPEMVGKWVCPMHPSVIKDGPAQRCDICGMRLVRAESLGYDVPDAAQPPPLVIPATAPLLTGDRAVVYVEVPDAVEPTYEGREVGLGPRAGDFYVVESGLREGERVVVEGNFKIDSALQIQAKPSMMSPAPHPTSQPAAGPTAQPASAPAAVPVHASAEAAMSLAPAIDAYVGLQAALAADDEGAARAAWKRLHGALGALALAEADASALEALLAPLRAAADAPPGDIEAMRTANGPLSAAMIGLVRGSHGLTERALHLFFCPMALENTGAEWLQGERALKNPYFGASMLTCGTYKGQLGQ